MLIKNLPNSRLSENEVTPERHFKARRRFLNLGAATIGGAALSGIAGGLLGAVPSPAHGATGKSLSAAKWSGSTDEKLTEFEDATTYNNFYEFGTSKSDPAKNAHTLKTKPWTVTVEGEVNKPGTFNLEDFIKTSTLEERIYRFRCVEAWSMVVPWVGISLKQMLSRFEPNSKAKYVEFTTLYDPEQMPGQKRRVLTWPYVEALRIDEAMNPLSIMAVGLDRKSVV